MGGWIRRGSIMVVAVAAMALLLAGPASANDVICGADPPGEDLAADVNDKVIVPDTKECNILDDVRVDADIEVGGDGAKLRVFGSVDGNIKVASGEVDVHGTVNGNIEGASKITLVGNYSVDGNVKHEGDDDIGVALEGSEGTSGTLNGNIELSGTAGLLAKGAGTHTINSDIKCSNKNELQRGTAGSGPGRPRGGREHAARDDLPHLPQGLSRQKIGGDSSSGPRRTAGPSPRG